MIGIINYGVGNVKAFSNIFKQLNVPFRLVSESSDLFGVDRIILPGVGAFDYAMKSFLALGIKDKLTEMVLEKKIPILGICVGMQMLADSSEEGNMQGFGWIKGIVRKFSITDKKHPVPHMGWNLLSQKENNKLFENLDKESRFYFLHSYYLACDDENNMAAVSNYQKEFCCVVRKENVYGIQCHPEKSHKNGTIFLKNFSEL